MLTKARANPDVFFPQNEDCCPFVRTNLSPFWLYAAEHERGRSTGFIHTSATGFPSTLTLFYSTKLLTQSTGNRESPLFQYTLS